MLQPWWRRITFLEAAVVIVIIVTLVLALAGCAPLEHSHYGPTGQTVVPDYMTGQQVTASPVVVSPPPPVPYGHHYYVYREWIVR